MTYRKKLIEVALPLEAINDASIREKEPFTRNHPRSLHIWWARRPLVACRAVLWSSLVDDPSEYIADEESANRERERLFSILEKLITWENNNNEEVLNLARLEIARSVARDLGLEAPIGKAAILKFLETNAPPCLDPFAGGGSIPFEAQRLGLIAYASDLNPVAVTINKALIEIPPQFADIEPIHPQKSKQGTILLDDWNGLKGLSADLRYYGELIQTKVMELVKSRYPEIVVSSEILEINPEFLTQGIKINDRLLPLAWLWTRTVTCPNPACGIEMPLTRSFLLSTRKGKEARINPVITGEGNIKTVRFHVTNKGHAVEGTVNRNGAHCIACGTPVSLDYIRQEGKQGKMGAKLMAIVAEGKTGRIFVSPFPEQENMAKNIYPTWEPETDLPEKALGFRVQLYGMNQHKQLFTKRQLNSLATYCDVICETREIIEKEAKDAKIPEPSLYANAITVYLALALSRWTDLSNTICSWNVTNQNIRALFSRQAIPMNWDYVELSPIHSFADFSSLVENTSKLLSTIVIGNGGKAIQRDAVSEITNPMQPLICTDPPYYDNIGYADLSDFFYVWLRHILGDIYPELFATMLVPKTAELIATPFRFDGDKRKAESFFENGLRKAFSSFYNSSSRKFPFTVFYAFKQSETDEESLNDDQSELSRTSTGWETMLEGLLSSGFQITGTWPMRTERSTRSVSIGTNALASSVVLVCRPRSKDVGSITRREFLSELKRELPKSLRQLQQGNIAPVDLAQAAIGPGMAIFSRYKTVLEATGDPMPVRAALSLINQTLDEYLAEQEGEYDGDTRWALAWFEQYGHDQGQYGIAETLSKAKNTSVEGLSHAGFLEARSGKVRLLRRDELGEDWDPIKDKRLTAWESAQHLIRTLDKEGEKGAGMLLSKLGSFGEIARDLAYRLYTICERKGWAQEALAYNMLVVAWPRIKEQSGKGPRQESLL